MEDQQIQHVFGPLAPLMYDPEVTEIMVNGHQNIFVERGGQMRQVRIHFDNDDQVRTVVERIIAMDPTKRIDVSSPYVDTATDNARINMAIPPVVIGGPHITIRKYLDNISSVEDLLDRQSLDLRMVRFLVACVRARMNLLFSGASGSGKTTLLEVLGRHIDHHERIVVIEDTPELRFAQPNVVRMLTRGTNIEGKGAISIGDLFRNALRMAPRRIILGEVRGKEALDYLLALNSGHRGSLAILHASSPEEAITRLENLVQFAGIEVPVSTVRHQIADGLDVICQIEQLADGTRKVTRISEIIGEDDQGSVTLTDLFHYQARDVDPEGKIHGRFVATGQIPGFWHKLELARVELAKADFEEG